MNSNNPPSRRRIAPAWIMGAVAVLVLLIVGVPWLYTNVLNDDQPAELTLPAASAAAGTSDPAATSAAETTAAAGAATSAAAAETSAAAGATSAAADTSAAGAAAGGSLNGTWTIGPESIVGYRVKEVLLGQDTEGVGRTSDVTGDVIVAGDAVTEAKFTVDMTTIKSDKDRRDGQFQGRIMDTATHPTATFVATQPIPVPADASAGNKFTAKATGDLTLRGTTKSVTFDVTGQKSAAGFDVTAQIPIVFSDYNIPDPSFGPAKVGKDGTLEVLLKLVPKS